jgi:hypothetical protein
MHLCKIFSFNLLFQIETKFRKTQSEIRIICTSFFLDVILMSVYTAYQMKRITVDFEDELHLKLKIQCAKESTPITDLIRRLVLEYLEKAEKKLKK